MSAVSLNIDKKQKLNPTSPPPVENNSSTICSNTCPNKTEETCDHHHHQHHHHHRRRHCPRRVQISLLHSSTYTNTLYKAMKYIHEDRDLLLSSLLYYCGFIKQTPDFFRVVKPKIARREHLESFHDSDYLDFIECSNDNHNHNNDRNNIGSDYDSPSHQPLAPTLPTSRAVLATAEVDMRHILDSYGLVDDCPLPRDIESRMNLWRYCLHVSGASLHGAELLLNSDADVAINFGGGRHHAHENKAGGFCFVNDVVLAIQKLIGKQKFGNRLASSKSELSSTSTSTLTSSSSTSKSRRKRRVLYLDLDIHHCDGVQSAFYDSDQVMVVSLHRYTPGFFPSTSGSIHQKGKHKTPGVGFNLNIPMPRSCKDIDFVNMCRCVCEYVMTEFDPDFVVLCVGADGLRDDHLVKETCEGWNLTPEGLAECVKAVALECAGGTNQHRENSDNTNTSSVAPSTNNGKKSYQKSKRRRKLLLLGGGGYNPTSTARTFLLCTAAACEGSRPGMLNELPRDVPEHEFFSRYGPSFELYSKDIFDSIQTNSIKHPCSKKSSQYWFERNNVENEYSDSLRQGIEAINLVHSFLKNRVKDSIHESQSFDSMENILESDSFEGENGKKFVQSRRRRKKRKITLFTGQHPKK